MLDESDSLSYSKVLKKSFYFKNGKDFLSWVRHEMVCPHLGSYVYVWV